MLSQKMLTPALRTHQAVQTGCWMLPEAHTTGWTHYRLNKVDGGSEALGVTHALFLTLLLLASASPPVAAPTASTKTQRQQVRRGVRQAQPRHSYRQLHAHDKAACRVMGFRPSSVCQGFSQTAASQPTTGHPHCT